MVKILTIEAVEFTLIFKVSCRFGQLALSQTRGYKCTQPFYSENFDNKGITSVKELKLGSVQNESIVSNPIFVSNTARGEYTLKLFRMDVCRLWGKVEH